MNSGTVIVLLLLLACPLGMFFMHRRGGTDFTLTAGQPTTGRTRPRGTATLATAAAMSAMAAIVAAAAAVIAWVLLPSRAAAQDGGAESPGATHVLPAVMHDDVSSAKVNA